MIEPQPTPEQTPLARTTGSLSDNAKDSALIHEAGRAMAMYVAIVGRLPAIDPTVCTSLDEIEDHPIRRDRPWSPFVLSIYLRDIARQGALRLHRPEITAWIRRQSEIAMRRLHESHTRMLAAKNDRAA